MEARRPRPRTEPGGAPTDGSREGPPGPGPWLRFWWFQKPRGLQPADTAHGPLAPLWACVHITSPRQGHQAPDSGPLLGKGTGPQTRALSSARAPGPRLGPAHAHNDLVLTCFQQSRPRSLPEQLEPQLPGAARVWKNSLEPPPQRSRVTGRNTDAGGESAAQVPSSCFE